MLRRLRTLSLPMVLILIAACAAEEESAPPPATTVPAAPSGPALGPKELTFASGPEQVVAYQAKPAGQGPFPALVMIHEWWGLNDQIRDLADRFAEEGYLTLAVDLYRGKVTDDPDEAHELMRGLPEDRALRDLRAAFDFLKSRPEVKPERIGSVGWCMGGGYSVRLATVLPDLAACAVYYGPLPTERASLEAIEAPLIGFFGDQDQGIPEASVLAFEKTMRELRKDAEIHIYKNAGHGFANPEGKNYYELAADEAWKQLMGFLAKHLRT